MSVSVNDSVGKSFASSSSTTRSPSATRFCRCGLPASIVMCWSKDNAGRRFLGCPNYGNSMFCGYMVWYDEPTPERYRKIIYGLVKKREGQRLKYGSGNKLLGAMEDEEDPKATKSEDKVGKLSSEKRRLKLFIVVSWVLFLWYVLGRG